MIRWLKKGLLNGIYPRSCELCEAPPMSEVDLCSDCFGEFDAVVDPFCPKCGEAINGAVSRARDCPNCHGSRKPYDFARAGYSSHHGSRELVHRFKYSGSFHLGRTLARMAIDALEADPRLAEEMDWVLIPVPLHRKRRRQRGFNQANEIATQLSKQTGLVRKEALRRIRATKTQTKLSRWERKQNLRGAIELKPRYRECLDSQPVLLIDDVFTTGSTIEECARVIRRNAKPSKIAALTPLRA